jgi:hypothetical protein
MDHAHLAGGCVMGGKKGLFALDEMGLLRVAPDWNRQDLLRQKGIFFLKDILALLDLSKPRVLRMVKALEEEDKDPYRIMGVRKIWQHWIVRMKVFAPYYREKMAMTFRQIEPQWNGNDLLQQEGLFPLSEVCEHLPFGAHSIRYQAGKRENSREQIGVWKDKDLNIYLVDMPIFAAWLKEIWGALLV